MDVGAHRVGREVLFPQARCEFGDAAGGMLADPLQHIDEIGVRIDAVKSAGDDQTLDDADTAQSRRWNDPPDSSARCAPASPAPAR
jgi:hypothetical protein